MHANHNYQKGCPLFFVKISNDDKANNHTEMEESEILQRHPTLQEFKDMNPKDIPEFPSHREVEFQLSWYLDQHYHPRHHVR